MKQLYRVAVLGANGYIGRHVVWYLKEYYDIVAEEFDLVEDVRPHYHRLDLTDSEMVKKITWDYDYVFQLIGLSGTYVGFDKYDTYVRINISGLLNLLDAIRQSPYRPRIVYPSSRLVYKGGDKPLVEEAEKEQNTVYAMTKIAGEGLLHAYWQSFGIPYTVFRICVPYGNLLSKDYSFGTVGFFVKQCKAGQDISLYGGGHLLRTFTHMEDLCFQLIEGSFRAESVAETYNVGGETLSLRQVATLIAESYGNTVKDVEWPEKDWKIESGHTFFDDSKIQKLLGPIKYRRMEEFKKDL